ncbi:pitrilysin family protein [Chroococcidiopsis sp. TS-821]|uniref:M16 family metallopeptidase n=1 Tax=Chroococcidiopsis sp. TS-821 TaxID=1378066 RepID=UPI000CEE6919|nr:pitrilysin family protein [Chroococcidiopsis sp. TS-821]PPS43226.1 peptidase M16 [Chroococcidiopsis sp. TS-821]
MFFSKRRQWLAILLFSFCLSGVLLLNSSWAATQPEPTQIETTNTSVVNQPLSITENVRKTVLENGLTVLTKEVRTAPVVSVQVWYQIGSRDEAPGVNGIAHQLEHMLFKGTTERPIQFGRLFSALGSDSNAFTSYDQTAYFGTVERNKLQALLVLEADRMQNALIDAAELESEKRVVISELQGYENDPGYRLSRAVMRAVFPNSPYGLPVGGTKADVQNFTVEQVREYYRNYYNPKNATLVVVGDFDTDTTLATIEETFGKIPNQESAPNAIGSEKLRSLLVQSRRLESNTTNKPQTANAPIVLREPGAAALIQTVYPLPTNINHPDVPALDVMDYILTEGRNSRLYRALIETGLASSARGYVASMKSSGWYRLSATAAPGQELPKIDSVMQQAIAQLQTQGVTQEEVNRAKALVKATVILSNRDITSQAMQLGYDQTTAGNYRFTDRYLAAIEQVTPADVQRVAKTYLQPEKRRVGLFEPTAIAAEDQFPGAADATQTHESLTAGPPADPAEVAKYLPPIESATPTARQLPEQFKLTNGLEVLLLPDKSTPTVTLSGYIKAGSEYDINAKAGLAALTADNLMNGTKTKDAQALAAALENRGARLEFAAFREGVDATGYSLATDLPVLIETFADVMQNANFPANELELARQRALTNLKLELDSPAQVARRQFQQTVYPPNHPYHSFPTAESLQQISRADVMRFYQQHYRPDQVFLALVGDFEPQQVRSLLEQQFKNWRSSGKPPALDYPQVSLPKSIVQRNPVLPGKTQAVTLMGYRGIERRDPRYYSALVLNQILGGDTLSSRLGTEIRDRQGLTYGIYSYFIAGRNPGPFLIQMQTSPEDAARAIASTTQLLQQVHNQGVSQNELDTAKRSLTSSYTVSLANPDSIATQILMNAVYELGTAELRAFPQKIQSVTLAQVNQVAKELLQPNNLVVVTAGPGNTAANR